MGVTANGYGVSFASTENVLKLTVVIVVQLGEYSQPTKLYPFKKANCTIWEFPLIRTIRKDQFKEFHF